MMRQRNILILLLLLNSASAWAGKPDPHHYANWLGPETCAECHEDEATIWRHAHHAKSFKKMPRSKDGKKMAKALGVKRIKMSKECGVCHVSYTPKNGGKRLKAAAGVSCESCHGAAKNWNDIHHDYGGQHVTAAQESAAHKKERIAKSEAAGMIRPIRKYKIFKQCYQCHTVPSEALINKTDHPVGDKFELVKWSNGEVRHNVWHSKGKVNKIRPREQQRVRYVMGQALSLEFALRGLAQAKGPGKYADGMASRAKQAINNLQQINSKLSIKEVADMLAIAQKTELNYQQRDKLIAAADKISELNQRFVEQHDGKAFATIDNVLPKEYKGKPKS